MNDVFVTVNCYILKYTHMLVETGDCRMLNVDLDSTAQMLARGVGIKTDCVWALEHYHQCIRQWSKERMLKNEGLSKGTCFF